MSARLVTQAEAHYALTQLRYELAGETIGLVYFEHVDARDIPIILDFSKGPIPYDIFVASLEVQGINLDALHVYLDD